MSRYTITVDGTLADLGRVTKAIIDTASDAPEHCRTIKLVSDRMQALISERLGYYTDGIFEASENYTEGELELVDEFFGRLLTSLSVYELADMLVFDTQGCIAIKIDNYAEG